MEWVGVEDGDSWESQWEELHNEMWVPESEHKVPFWGRKHFGSLLCVLWGIWTLPCGFDTTSLCPLKTGPAKSAWPGTASPTLTVSRPFPGPWAMCEMLVLAFWGSVPPHHQVRAC